MAPQCRRACICVLLGLHSTLDGKLKGLSTEALEKTRSLKYLDLCLNLGSCTLLIDSVLFKRTKMEAYPAHYVEHQLPLVVLSGLGEREDVSPKMSELPRQESGSRITTASAVCDDSRAGHLLDQLFLLDGTNRHWNSTSLPGPPGQLMYKMKAIGRVGTAAG